MLTLTRLLVIVPLLGIMSAGVPRGDPPKPKVDLPAEIAVEPGTSRAWALMTCSVPFARDGFRHDLLAGAISNENNVEAMRKVLEANHGVKRRIDLVNVLDKLVAEGRRATVVSLFRQIRDLKLTEADLEYFEDVELRERLRVLMKHAKRMKGEKAGLLAFDYVNYVTLCRYGYGAGYFTEAEAWKRIGPIVKKLQSTYDSWEELGEIYAIGEEFTGSRSSEKTWAAWEKLKTDEKSPWLTVAWNLKLAPLDKPEPPAKK